MSCVEAEETSGKMNCQIINTKLGDIEYSSIGKGIPILFLHGGHSNCKEKLSHKGFDLAKFQLITPSRPGYGKTPLGNNKTPKKAADLIIELLNYLSLQKVIVYGISAGGLTAIELTANYPDKVNKLILASAVSKKWLDNNGKTYITANMMFNPKIESFIWSIVKLSSRVFPKMIARSFFPQFSSSQLPKLRKEDVQELVSSMKHYHSKNGFVNDINQNIEEETLAKIICPTLIIHSENDNSVSLEHPENANRLIENSEIEILQNKWGHLFWIGTGSKESIEKTIKFIEK